MSKKYHHGLAGLWIVLIIAVIVGGGITAYVMTDGFGLRSKPSENQESDSGQAANNKNQPVTGEDTLAMVRDALDGKYEVQCNAEVMREGKHAKVDLMIRSQSILRMEIRTDMGTENSIVIGEDNFNWMEGSSEGSVTQLADRPANLLIEDQWKDYVEQSRSGSDNQTVACQQVKIDDAQLQVPTDVKFN